MSSLEQVLKAYEGPDQFFLHNINACRRAPTGNTCTIMRAIDTVAHRFNSGPRVYSRAAGRPGGAGRSRTDDILLAKQALYQLSYGPVPENGAKPRRAVGDLSAKSSTRPESQSW